jgi:hypothetical protein
VAPLWHGLCNIWRLWRIADGIVGREMRYDIAAFSARRHSSASSPSDSIPVGATIKALVVFNILTRSAVRRSLSSNS